MKKTLFSILLAVCVGSASAVTIEDAVASANPASSTITFDPALTALTVVTTIDPTALLNAMSAENEGTVVLSISGYKGTDYTTMGFITVDGGLKAFWRVGNGADNLVLFNDVLTNYVARTETVAAYAANGLEKINIALTSAPNSNLGIRFWANGGADKASYQADGVRFSGQTYDTVTLNTDIVTSAYVFDSNYYNTPEIDQIEASLPAVIPEPATATLSLLALAGLAARRRRK